MAPGRPVPAGGDRDWNAIVANASLNSMITLDPIARALVAADSEAADKLGAPNYESVNAQIAASLRT